MTPPSPRVRALRERLHNVHSNEEAWEIIAAHDEEVRREERREMVECHHCHDHVGMFCSPCYAVKEQEIAALTERAEKAEFDYRATFESLKRAESRWTNAVADVGAKEASCAEYRQEIAALRQRYEAEIDDYDDRLLKAVDQINNAHKEITALREELAKEKKRSQHFADAFRRESWVEDATLKDIPGPYVPYADYEKLREERDAAYREIEAQRHLMAISVPDQFVVEIQAREDQIKMLREECSRLGALVADCEHEHPLEPHWKNLQASAEAAEQREAALTEAVVAALNILQDPLAASIRACLKDRAHDHPLQRAVQSAMETLEKGRALAAPAPAETSHLRVRVVAGDGNEAQAEPHQCKGGCGQHWSECACPAEKEPRCVCSFHKDHRWCGSSLCECSVGDPAHIPFTEEALDEMRAAVHRSEKLTAQDLAVRINATSAPVSTSGQESSLPRPPFRYAPEPDEERDGVTLYSREEVLRDSGWEAMWEALDKARLLLKGHLEGVLCTRVKVGSDFLVLTKADAALRKAKAFRESKR